MPVANRRAVLGTLCGLWTAGLAGCSGGGGDDEAGSEAEDGSPGTGSSSTTTGDADAEPALASPAFDDGTAIPTRHSCDGGDVSPALSIDGVADDAASLALVVDDPDAPGRTFTHWLLWDVPASTTAIPEAVPTGETVPDIDGASQGTNDAGVVGYSGPCPPPDDGPHTYRFRLIALAEALDVEPGADRSAFDSAVEGIERSEALLSGTYDR